MNILPTPILTTSPIHFSSKGWESVLGSVRAKTAKNDSQLPIARLFIAPVSRDTCFHDERLFVAERSVCRAPICGSMSVSSWQVRADRYFAQAGFTSLSIPKCQDAVERPFKTTPSPIWCWLFWHSYACGSLKTTLNRESDFQPELGACRPLRLKFQPIWPNALWLQSARQMAERMTAASERTDLELEKCAFSIENRIEIQTIFKP